MRTEGDFIKINEWLLPLSWLYGLGVRFRNMMFNVGILKSRAYDIPVISVGNITVGGSGKTPHVEYLISLLSDKMKVAVLSRGYKRKSHGYVLATDGVTMRDIGDEPYQMRKKFKNIYIAVDKNRRHGIPGKHAIIVKSLQTKESDKLFSAQFIADPDFKDAPVEFTLSPKRGKNILDVLNGRRVGGIQVSPSGKYLIMVEGEIIKGKSSSMTNVYRIADKEIVLRSG